MRAHKPLAAVAALLIALSAVGGAVDLAQSDPVADVIENTTGFDTATISPVGDAKALATGTAIIIGVVVGAAACQAEVAGICAEKVSKKKLNQIDALETKASIHGNAATLYQKNEELLKGFSNHLEATTLPATTKGKNALIRAYENGTTTSLARAEAYEAIEDYYAARQMTLIQSWESTVVTARHMRAVANNTANMTEGWPTALDEKGYPSIYVVDSSSIDDWTVNKTVTLVNGSTVTVQSFAWDIRWKNGDGNGWDNNYVKLTPARGFVDTSSNDIAPRIYVPAPSSDFSNQPLIRPKRWEERWNSIETKTQQIKDRMANFYNATHTGYEQGTITTKELVDPYLAARKYSPAGSWGTWTLRTLISAGYGSPAELASIGTMNITDGNQTVSGLLLSDGLPPGNSFQAGVTYNASVLNGTQYVMSPKSKQLYRLEGNFTITSITAPNGTSLESVEYNTIDYQHADTADYQKTLNALQEKHAEINARQEKLRDNLDGSGGIPTLPGLGIWGTLAVIGGALLVISIASN